MYSLKPFALAFATMAAAVGCAAADAPDAPKPPPAVTTPSPPAPPPSFDQVIEAAIKLAAQRDAIHPEQVRLVSADRVTWRDSSLGCPRPGMTYMSVLVPGYRIRLRTPRFDHDYHANLAGDLQLCPAKMVQEPIQDGVVVQDPRDPT